MTLRYLFAKIIKKMPGSAIKNSYFEKPSKCEAQSTIVNSSFGYYSYCGYRCTILNTSIGRFSSIADDVTIGVSNHPINWVSTSPVFYNGNDSIPKNLAKLVYLSDTKKTTIGNDVWIGKGAIIMAGVTIGDGVIVGAGAVVTHDVEAYSIIGGVPAKNIRKRFPKEIIDSLIALKWWDMPLDELYVYSEYMDNIELFLKKVNANKRYSQKER